MTMQSLSDEQRKEILGEALFNELRAIRGYVQQLPEIKKGLEEIIKVMKEIRSDMKVLDA